MLGTPYVGKDMWSEMTNRWLKSGLLSGFRLSEMKEKNVSIDVRHNVIHCTNSSLTVKKGLGFLCGLEWSTNHS